jgi:hypothetical protein
VTSLQVTVRTWTPDGGSAVTDGGEVVELPADCLLGSPFRFVRTGQRLRVVLDGDRVVSVGLV